MASARAAPLVAPGPKLAAVRSLLDAGATAKLTLELTGADGVAATSVLTSTDHLDLVATVWTALHALPVTAPDPFAATRAACNALGRAAQADAALAEARTKLAAVAAEVASLEAKRASLPGSSGARASLPGGERASTPPPTAEVAKPAGDDEEGGGQADGGAGGGAGGDGGDGGGVGDGVPAGAAEGADAVDGDEEHEEHATEPTAAAKSVEKSARGVRGATRPAAKPAAKPAAAKPATEKRGTRKATIGGKSVTYDELSAAVAESRSWRDVAAKLGCGGSKATTKARETWEKWNPGGELPFPAPGRGRPQAAGAVAEAPEPKRQKAVKPEAEEHAKPKGTAENGDLF